MYMHFDAYPTHSFKEKKKITKIKIMMQLLLVPYAILK